MGMQKRHKTGGLRRRAGAVNGIDPSINTVGNSVG